MILSKAEPLIKLIMWILKFICILVFIRGVLYVAGFRYNIPLIDDIIWPIVGVVISWGVRTSKAVSGF